MRLPRRSHYLARCLSASFCAPAGTLWLPATSSRRCRDRCRWVTGYSLLQPVTMPRSARLSHRIGKLSSLLQAAVQSFQRMTDHACSSDRLVSPGRQSGVRVKFNNLRLPRFVDHQARAEVKTGVKAAFRRHATTSWPDNVCSSRCVCYESRVTAVGAAHPGPVFLVRVHRLLRLRSAGREISAAHDARRPPSR